MEYQQQSQIANAIFLNPFLAGYSSSGNFCYAMARGLRTSGITESSDVSAFLIQFLSLAVALHDRHLAFRWDPDDIIMDACTGKLFLAGFTSLRRGVAAELRENSIRILSALENFASAHQCDAEIRKTIKRWERRKERNLSGCLEDILRKQHFALELLPTIFEWERPKEVELVTGLFQLAEGSRGRSVLFQSDRGEGKSSLLRQLFRRLAVRNCSITYFQAEKEERPYYSLKKLIDLFFENIGAYKSQKNDLGATRWSERLDRPGDISQEDLIAQFLRLITRLIQERNQVFIFLIDDISLFDSFSLNFLGTLLRKIDSHPLLFVLTSLADVTELTEPVLILPLHSTKFNDFDRAYGIPLWKTEQRELYLQQIHKRTSGNPLLFDEYLCQTLRQRQSQISWEEGEWSFRRHEIPAFPNVLLDFYLQQIPPVSPDELLFLELASVQGEIFDPELYEKDIESRKVILRSLTEKGVLSHSEKGSCFRKPLLAEALRQRIEPERLRKLHLDLANELMKLDRPELAIIIAHHLLHAGDYSGALHLACSALEERPTTTEALLPIFERLESNERSLATQQQLKLYRASGGLFFRRGNYFAAIEKYTRALDLLDSNIDQKFELSVRIAQAHLLNNDIFSAQKILNAQAAHLSNGMDQKTLLDFYLARGYCAWHRGERQTSDFQQAMEIAETLQDYDSLSKGYRQHAELNLREGLFPEARSLARKALQYSQKTGNSEEMGHALRVLGSIGWRQSKYKSAEQFLKRSLRLLQRVENHSAAARAWTILGNIYAERCMFRQSVDAIQNALRLFSQQDHPYETSLAEFNLGLVHVEQGHLNQAEKIFVRCRTVDKKTGNKRFYAYDLRALAVVCVLRGFYKKAARLLKRTIEICEELKAEPDILQTKMILLFNELEQKNYRQSAPLLSYLESQLAELEDAKTQAEIHYLLAHYSGYINETQKAVKHLHLCLQLARPIRYYRLLGQATMLQLIFKNVAPARNDPEFKKALRYFQRSRNELELCNYLLKLYQAYPGLIRQSEHDRRLLRMERIFREVRHRTNYRSVRQLRRGYQNQGKANDPLYEWWHGLLEILTNKTELSGRLTATLAKLSVEFNASSAVLRYLNEYGTYERIVVSGSATENVIDDLETKIFEMVIERREPLCLTIAQHPEFATHPWVVLHEVNSVLCIPIMSSGQVCGVWYFERRAGTSVFSRKELNKASFFSLATAPLLENALKEEFARRTSSSPKIESFKNEMIGNSKCMRELYQQMEKVAPVDISVLIVGESGTGKELVARMLHKNSKRSDSGFLALNCSALPETLIESELFGYNKGAFTGATSNKAGLIERANKGTLFLDEIGDLSLAAQAKLLRVMQEREIQRLGDTIVRKVDVRFLFATHKDLKKLIRDGNYRDDLYYRISAYTLSVPPLRDRKDDIPLLLRYLSGKYCQSFGKINIGFSAAAMRALCEYHWPGNVRELENTIQTLLVNHDSGAVIDMEGLPAHFSAARMIDKLNGKSLEAARQEFEKEFVLQVLQKYGWNKTHSARELKVTRQGLVNMIQRLGIQEPER